MRASLWWWPQIPTTSPRSVCWIKEKPVFLKWTRFSTPRLRRKRYDRQTTCAGYDVMTTSVTAWLDPSGVSGDRASGYILHRWLSRLHICIRTDWLWKNLHHGGMFSCSQGNRPRGSASTSWGLAGQCGEPRDQQASPETSVQWDRAAEGHVVVHGHRQLSGDLQWGAKVQRSSLGQLKLVDIICFTICWFLGTCWVKMERNWTLKSTPMEQGSCMFQALGSLKSRAFSTLRRFCRL